MDFENIIPTHIQITNRSKISNPYNKGTVNKFYGDVNGFEFGHQSKNYDQLCKKLLDVGVRFNKIFSSSIERQMKNSVQYGTTFIVTSSHPQVFWYKYEGNSLGSGGNHMLINGSKIKVTEFLNFNENDIVKLINDSDQ